LFILDHRGAQILKQLAANRFAEEQRLPSQKPRKERIGAAAGIATPMLAFACIMSAISSYPSFSWTNNALSDLGIVPGVTGPLFNLVYTQAGFWD